MEELAIKLAETLDISVQAAIDIYPVVRRQFIWYQMLTGIGYWVTFFALISFVLAGVTLYIRFDLDKFNWSTEEINEDWVAVDKVFKKALLVLFLSAVIAMTIDVITPFLAPDIMLLKDFIGS